MFMHGYVEVVGFIKWIVAHGMLWIPLKPLSWVIIFPVPKLGVGGGDLTAIFLDHQGYCTKLYCGSHVLFVFVVVTLILSCDCRCNLWLLWGEDNHVFCLARPLHHSSDCARCGWFYFLGKRQTLSVHAMKIVHYFCLSQILFLTFQSCLHFFGQREMKYWCSCKFCIWCIL